MARKKNSSPLATPAEHPETAAAQEEKVSISAAKVTLVKPMQMQDSSADGAATPALSPARPKIGRFPAIAAVAEKPENIPVLSLAEKPFGTRPLGETKETLVPDAADNEPDPDQPRPWDFKFAMFLLALLVIVNLGLVLLLHNNHKQENAVAEKRPAPVSAAPVAAPAPPAVTPPAALPVAAAPPPAPVAAAPAPAPVKPAVAQQPAAASQDLLSIISKE